MTRLLNERVRHGSYHASMNPKRYKERVPKIKHMKNDTPKPQTLNPTANDKRRCVLSVLGDRAIRISSHRRTLGLSKLKSNVLPI